MTTRLFEYRDEKLNKFWEITIEGCKHTVRYGRIGSDGQSKSKCFDSEEAAVKEAEKLIAQKIGKGYIEVTSASSGKTNNPVELKFRALIGGLCKTDDDNRILDALCAALVDMDDEVITFKESECNYVKGGKIIYKEWVPRSFSEIAGFVSELYWDGGGPEIGYSISEDGSPRSDAWLFDELKYDSPEECARIEAAGSVTASFLAGQNGIFFDPTASLSNGEPGMAFVSHEGDGWVPVKSVQNYNYGQILLRMLADAMIDTTHIPEIYF